MKSLNIILLASIGLVLIVCAMVFLKAPKRTLPGTVDVARIRIEENFATGSNASGWKSDAIDIVYLPSMRVSDSDVIEVRWTPRGPGHFPHASLFLLDKTYDPKQAPIYEEKNMVLSGGAFDIKPEESQSRSLKQDESSAKWIWSISPNKEGNHKLVLDLQDLEIRLTGFDHHAAIRRNEEEWQPIDRPGLKDVVLPIEVLTKEGLSKNTFLAIKYCILVLGAFLLYPAVSTVITNYLQQRSTGDSPATAEPSSITKSASSLDSKARPIQDATAERKDEAGP